MRLAGAEDTGVRGRVLVVDWPRCRGHGVCIQAFPELVGRDPWGYPVVSGEEIPDELMGHARRAVRGCPENALRLVAVRHPSG
ncbi:MAG: ferredoxin [Kineosporiaceae bacterium]